MHAMYCKCVMYYVPKRRRRRDSIQSIRLVTLACSVCITLILSFHPRTLHGRNTSNRLEESHASVRPTGLSMNYGKRVHNSPVSHAFTRPSNRRRVHLLVGSTKTTTTKCCLVSLISLTRNYTHRHDSRYAFVVARPITSRSH